MPYALIGRIVCWIAPKILRRQLAANRDRLVAGGLILGVVAVGIVIAHQDDA